MLAKHRQRLELVVLSEKYDEVKRRCAVCDFYVNVKVFARAGSHERAENFR
jgi:hypothetical protein